MIAVEQPEHIDFWLLRKIKTIAIATLNVSACYVLPASGGFIGGHISLNLKGASRCAPWGEKWCVPGTNRYNAGAHRPAEDRWLCRIVSAGQAEYLRPVKVPAAGDELMFRTPRPPDDHRDEDPHWRAVLRDLGWIDSDNKWVGPWFTDRISWTEPAWKGRSKAAS